MVSQENRVSFDPTLRDAGIPDETPAFPIGALDELQELGLNPEHYGCCAKRNKALGIRGCEFFNECPLSIKGKPSTEGGGPRRMAWERIFKGKPIRRREGTCWKLVKDKEFVEDNRGAVRIIAGEGETYEKQEGVAVKTFVDDRGEVQRVLAKEGEYHLPTVQRADMVVTKTVRPFVRPSKNPEIATDVITAKVIREEHERISAEAVPAALGIQGGSTPLDKRNKRAGKGQGEGA